MEHESIICHRSQNLSFLIKRGVNRELIREWNYSTDCIIESLRTSSKCMKKLWDGKMRVSIYQQTFERNKLTKMLLREKRELREILERFALRLQVSQFFTLIVHWWVWKSKLGTEIFWIFKKLLGRKGLKKIRNYLQVALKRVTFRSQNGTKLLKLQLVWFHQFVEVIPFNEFVKKKLGDFNQFS